MHHSTKTLGKFKNKIFTMKLTILILIFSQMIYSQNSEIDKLLISGDEAYLKNDFESSKKIYSSVVEHDSLNKKAWFNLAASELNLGENDNACEHLFKSYTLKDRDAINILKQYCNNDDKYIIMSIKDVDQKPKFIYKGEAIPLFVDNNLNKKYLEILVKEVRSSDVLKKAKGKEFIEFHVNRKGKFDGSIIRVDSPNEYREPIKMKLLQIFTNTVTYTPAIHKAKVVEWENTFMLPLDFGQ